MAEKTNTEKTAKLVDEGKLLKVLPRLALRMTNAAEYDENLPMRKIIKDYSKVEIDLSELSGFDSYLVVWLESAKKVCKEKEIEFDVIGISDKLESFIGVFSEKEAISKADPKKDKSIFNLIEQIGKGTITSLKDAKSFVEFVGEMVIKLANLLIRPWDMRWADFPYQFFRSGVTALPIVFMIVFLIGIITGYQGSMQLAQFGADIYIADLIGISITRELAPLMTAILVAGRSGSAFAAEIGTMKVSEEIDALGSMGFDHYKFLVLPRVIAVTLAMPMLTIMADFAGVGGGLISAISTLDVTITGYLNQLQIALSYSDVFTGLGKSMIFGFLIATVGCFRGMQVSGGAESVGKYTTASVVTGVFLIIVTDAVFTFVFQALSL